MFEVLAKPCEVRTFSRRPILEMKTNQGKDNKEEEEEETKQIILNQVKSLLLN